MQGGIDNLVELEVEDTLKLWAIEGGILGCRKRNWERCALLIGLEDTG